MKLPIKLYKYIGRDLGVVFLMSLTVLTMLYTIIGGLKGVGMGLSTGIVMSWLSESIGFSFFYTVPISLLLAGSLCFGRLVSDREYTAMAASGLSPLHVYVPMFVLTLFISIIGLATHGWLISDSHYAQRNITRFLLEQLDDLGNQRQGQLPLHEDDGRLFYEEVRDGKVLLGVQLSKMFDIGQLPQKSSGDSSTNPEQQAADLNTEKRKVPFLLQAESATLSYSEEKKSISLTLYNVDFRLADPNSNIINERYGWRKAWTTGLVHKFLVEFPLEQKRRREGDLRNDDLLKKIDEMETELARIESGGPLAAKSPERLTKQIRDHRCEYWRRKALTLSILTFGLLSFPISLSMRYRHRLVGLFIGCMIVIFIFYPLLIGGETLAKFGVPIPIAMLLGNIVISSIAAVYTGRLLTR